MSEKQVRVHLDRLVELEYVIPHGGRGGQRFVYELAFDGDVDSERPQAIGLIDIGQPASTGTTPNLVGVSANLVASTPNLVGRSWADSGPVVGRSSPLETARKPNAGADSSDSGGDLRENARPRSRLNGKPSYSSSL